MTSSDEAVNRETVMIFGCLLDYNGYLKSFHDKDAQVANKANVIYSFYYNLV